MSEYDLKPLDLDELTKRLRDPLVVGPDGLEWAPGSLMIQAANELTRLRAALAEAERTAELDKRLLETALTLSAERFEEIKVLKATLAEAERERDEQRGFADAYCTLMRKASDECAQLRSRAERAEAALAAALAVGN